MFALLPYVPCTNLEFHTSEDEGTELTIGIENTFSEY